MSNPLEVRSSVRSYLVHLGDGLLERCGELALGMASVKKGTLCAVITDENVAALYATPVMTSL